MPTWKAGGYTVKQYAFDHNPPHVHVYLDRRLMAKVVIPEGSFMYLRSKNHRGRILAALSSLGLVY